VDAWRERTSAAKPSNGVPAHVTILFPFIPADEIDDELPADVQAVFGRFLGFSFELREARRFPGVLYLAPEPPEPFVALTEAVVAAYPAYTPYGGEFDSIVPHLTAAEGDPELLNEAERAILPSLPISAEAHEVVLLEEVEPNLARWRTRARIPLGRP
jgi:hypothetical protein